MVIGAPRSRVAVTDAANVHAKHRESACGPLTRELDGPRRALPRPAEPRGLGRPRCAIVLISHQRDGATLARARETAAHAILRSWKRGEFEINFPKRFTLGLKLLGLLPFHLYQSLVLRGTAR